MTEPSHQPLSLSPTTMAHLTKPTVYNIEDTNIALLGSDLEKRVREHAGDSEAAWDATGSEEGLRIWRVEQFHIVAWPVENYGSFYDGDSYIILYTYKSSPEAKSLSYNLHFWLGQNTTLDEAGTAAYKTVELDDHLNGKPVQFREVQGSESPQFLSYFPKFTSLKGGAATGFHHVIDLPPLDIHKLYRVTFSRSPSTTTAGRFSSTLVVREVDPIAKSLVAGDAYVLDKGFEVWQLNTKQSAGQEKYKAAEFAQSLAGWRKACDVKVFDEGTSGVFQFLSEFGESTGLLPQEAPVPRDAKLFKLSDASGHVSFTRLAAVSRDLLASEDAFLLDDSTVVYVWVGKRASILERRLIVQYAQQYLNEDRQSHGGGRRGLGVPIVKMEEGNEVEGFFRAFGTE
ncbi:hypothetical protein D9611_010995 [Ephemerocybe angulata]|uniref:Gelsolin-like domain-containing protein n=1 Tax=Ephemerocybe angulata TaxID=980116 RepID=A0A8H5BAY7_9AGAR|nr:hypothetical protein D9611_010995 [Tulosesus angulatus]